MNRKLLLLIISLVALFSCRDNIKPKEKFVYDYEVYKTNDIILAEEDRGKYVQTYEQLVNIDGRDVLVFNIGYNHLSFYELESGIKIHDILVDTLNTMRRYCFIGKDSIFICKRELKGGMELDSPQALQLIDWNGNVKKVYGYEIDQNELNSYKYDKNKLVPPQSNEFVFCRGNIIPQSTFYTSYGLLGTKESVDNPLPLGIRMDTKENEYHVSKHRKYSYIKEGMYYPTYCLVRVKKSANDLPIFRYPYSSSAFEWDFENDSVIEHYFKSELADSIMPLDYPSEYGYKVPYSYGEVLYDECNKVYVSNIYFNEEIYGEMKFGLIFADKNFKYIGEMYDNKYWPYVSNKDVLLDIRKKNDSVVTLNYIKLVKTDCDYDKYIDSCKAVLQTMRQNLENRKKALLDGCPSVNFVKSQMSIKESSYKILTLYCNEGCIGCEQIVLYTLWKNKEIINKVPLFIILSAYNEAHLDTYIRQNGLAYFDRIVSDTTGIMKSLANTNFLLSPRLTVVKEGTITLDTIYRADDIEAKLLPQLTGPDEYTTYILNDDSEVIVIPK